MHENDDSHLPGVLVDAFYFNSSGQAREVEVVDKRVCRPPRGVPSVGSYLVPISQGPVAQGQPLYNRPQPWRNRHIILHVGEGMVNATMESFHVGGVAPAGWLTRHVNINETFGLYIVLLQVDTPYLNDLRRAQPLVDVDNLLVVSASVRGGPNTSCRTRC